MFPMSSQEGKAELLPLTQVKLKFRPYLLASLSLLGCTGQAISFGLLFFTCSRRIYRFLHHLREGSFLALRTGEGLTKKTLKCLTKSIISQYPACTCQDRRWPRASGSFISTSCLLHPFRLLTSFSDLFQKEALCNLNYKTEQPQSMILYVIQC